MSNGEHPTDDRPTSSTHILDTGALQDCNQDPDVILDVDDVRVALIEFDLEDLNCHVSLKAEVANLVKVSVGADVHLGSVHLTIKDVHAPAYLQVKLGKLHAVLSRALTTLDRNPKLIESLGQAVGDAGDHLGRAAATQSGLGRLLALLRSPATAARAALNRFRSFVAALSPNGSL
jgi:hypothetical protein